MGHRSCSWILIALLLAAASVPAAAQPSPREQDGERAFLARHADDMAWLRVGLRALSEPSLEAYVAGVGRRLAAGRTTDDGLVFYVASDPEPNAFALPDGTVVVHTGLLALLQNEAQLAAVLGHELAHVLERHGYRGYRAAQRARIPRVGLVAATAILTRGRSPVAVLLAKAGADVITGVAVNGHARDLEDEADRLSLRYVVDAGYDPREAVALWRIMRDRVGDAGAAETWFFGRHSTIRDRITNLEREIAVRYGAAVAGGGLVRNQEPWEVALLRHEAARELRGARFDAAAAALQRLLQVAPADALAHLHLGNVHRARAPGGTPVEDAVRAYERARSLDPALAAVDRELGAYYYGLGDYGRAASHLEAYVARAPDALDAAEAREQLRSSRALGGRATPDDAARPAPPGETAPVLALVGRLRAPSSSERILAAIALGGAALDDSTAPLVTAALAMVLEDENTTVRQQAAAALARMGPRAAIAVPQLAALLERDDPFVHAYAVHALAAIGSAARPALPALRALAARADEQTRQAVRNAIADIEAGPRGPAGGRP